MAKQDHAPDEKTTSADLAMLKESIASEFQKELLALRSKMEHMEQENEELRTQTGKASPAHSKTVGALGMKRSVEDIKAALSILG